MQQNVINPKFPRTKRPVLQNVKKSKYVYFTIQIRNMKHNISKLNQIRLPKTVFL